MTLNPLRLLATRSTRPGPAQPKPAGAGSPEPTIPDPRPVPAPTSPARRTPYPSAGTRCAWCNDPPEQHVRHWSPVRGFHDWEPAPPGAIP